MKFPLEDLREIMLPQLVCFSNYANAAIRNKNKIIN
jgi:hypothetical protein